MTTCVELSIRSFIQLSSHKSFTVTFSDITEPSRIAVQFSSISSIINSSQGKSQWKASLKRSVLSPARNWPTDGRGAKVR